MGEASGSATEARRRGVGFPQMGLQEAVDAVVLAGQNGPNHTHDAFATYLGHSTSNSGAYRAKLAALRDWGLIERGDKERITLSSLAQDFVLAMPDHYKAKSLLLTAFESCRLFGIVYNDSAKNTPMDLTRIRNNALMRHGIAADQADRFVDSFIKSVVFAGLGDFDGSRLTLRQRGDAFNDEGDSPDMLSGSDSSSAPASIPSAVPSYAPMPVASIHSAPVALRQAWSIDGGEIEFVVRTPRPLPVDIYSLMAEMAKTAQAMADLFPQPDGFAGGEERERGQ